MKMKIYFLTAVAMLLVALLGASTAMAFGGDTPTVTNEITTQDGQTEITTLDQYTDVSGGSTTVQSDAYVSRLPSTGAIILPGIALLAAGAGALVLRKRS